MAIGAITTAHLVIPAPGENAVCPGSTLSDWVTIHDSLAATAATSTVLKTIMTVADANVHICRVPAGAVRVRFRARYVIAVTATGTQAVIQAYSIYDPALNLIALSSANVPTLVNNGTVRWERIDTTTIAGTGLTVPTAPSTDSLDATYGYSDPCVNAATSGTTFDLNGGAWIMALTKTAAVVTGGAGAIALQAQFLN